MAEYWDLYDRQRRLLGKLHRRGEQADAQVFLNPVYDSGFKQVQCVHRGLRI